MLSSDRLELIRQVSNEVTSRSRLYQDTVYNPDFILAYQGGVERTLCLIDEFVGSRYRDFRSDIRFINEAMKKSGISGPDLVDDLRAEMLNQAMILGVPKMTISRCVNQAVQNGVLMIAGRYSSFDKMMKDRNKSYPSNLSFVDVKEGGQYHSPRKGTTGLFYTGLTHNITE